MVERYAAVSLVNAGKLPKFHTYLDCPTLKALLDDQQNRVLEAFPDQFVKRLRLDECAACARRTRRAQIGVVAIREAIQEIDAGSLTNAREILDDLLTAFAEIEQEQNA